MTSNLQMILNILVAEEAGSMSQGTKNCSFFFDRQMPKNSSSKFVGKSTGAD